MKLTKRGNRVVGITFISFIIGTMFIAGRFEALDQCAEFEASNDYLSAQNA